MKSRRLGAAIFKPDVLRADEGPSLLDVTR